MKSEQEICIDDKQMDSSRDSLEAASGDDSRAGVYRSAMNNGGSESSGALSSLHELRSALAIGFKIRAFCCTICFWTLSIITFGQI